MPQYDYTFLAYTGMNFIVNIACQVHGAFEQKADSCVKASNIGMPSCSLGKGFTVMLLCEGTDVKLSVVRPSEHGWQTCGKAHQCDTLCQVCYTTPLFLEFLEP